MLNQFKFDFVIVGAGIVGLTVAHELLKRYPKSSIAIIEKENQLGLHASGRNSGVMHCGIYYGKDTVKARTCSLGAKRMIEFAKEENIAVSQCGKIILATREEQLPTINKLLQNAKENQIEAEKIDSQQLRSIEPYAAPGVAAIYCPSTAVIDNLAILERLMEKLKQQSVSFLLNCAFIKPTGKNQIQTSQGSFEYGQLVNCAGAYADVVAKAFGLAQDYALIPFKGIYWKLSQESNYLVNANIYPVPDVSLPFLGVHFTRGIKGDVYIGPTAIPAFGRENYGKLTGIQLSEMCHILTQLGKMYVYNENNFRMLAHMELGKYQKKKFLAAAQQLVPSLKAEHMVSTPKAGIRPQLVNIKSRKLEMDYLFEKTENTLHVLNAISPAFTGSFAFAELIVDQF